MSKKALVMALRQVAEIFDDLDDAQIQDFVDGAIRLGVHSARASKRRTPIEASGECDVSALKEKLDAAKSIDEGLQVLHAIPDELRRQTLSMLAKSFEIGVRKTEKLSELEDRIVKAVVGSRIQSETMRSLPI
jgi:hypothetical protein